MINSNASGRLIAARTADVPSRSFEAFQLYTGEGTQKIILSFKYTPYGNIDLVKVTANEEMCEGNPLYSVEGAVYTVHPQLGPHGRGWLHHDRQGRMGHPGGA